MKKNNYRILVAAAMLTILGGVATQAARMYTLDGIEVDADRQIDRFGNTITEQSYYRTGGDVNVIDSAQIEQRHYSTITSAIEHLPGVQVNSIGYHGGEYGRGSQYNTTVTINGDDHVVICLDGRRIDNAVSGVMTWSSTDTNALANLDQVTSIDNIDKIEVIKGPGASVYGADATGGVINIITKKGALKPQASIDLATGSWGHHVYRANMSGSSSDGSTRYFISAMRDMGGDTHYYDQMTGKNYTYHGTDFKDDAVNIRLDKYFNDTHRLTFSYNYKGAHDGYPTTTPDYRYMNPTDWYRIKHAIRVEQNYGGDIKVPGYRNDWYVYGFNGCYTAHLNNDFDLSYSFAKENEMESFVRVYKQSHKYTNCWGTSDGIISSKPILTSPWDPEWNDYVNAKKVTKDSHRNKDYEFNRGMQLQLGKSYGKHDILTGWTFDKSRTESFSVSSKTGKETSTNVKQTTIDGYLQDKIHVNDKFEIAPSLRYQHANAVSTTSETGKVTNGGSAFSKVTAAVNAQYLINDGFSIFAGWTQINRPLHPYDYQPGSRLYEDQKLENDKGSAYTIGLKKRISDRTNVFANYDYTDMSNAVCRQSVWDYKIEKWATKSVNAKQTRKAFNLGINQKLDQHWGLGLSYSTIDEQWTAKRGMKFQPGLGIDSMLINAYLNSTRPKNKYIADLTYSSGKWFSSLTTTIYSGMDDRYFTSNRFVILDWTLNYDVSKDWSVYATVDNLTNEGYEVKFNPSVGKGAYALPGRSFMLGAKYKF